MIDQNIDVLAMIMNGPTTIEVEEVKTEETKEIPSWLINNPFANMSEQDFIESDYFQKKLKEKETELYGFTKEQIKEMNRDNREEYRIMDCYEKAILTKQGHWEISPIFWLGFSFIQNLYSS